MPRCGGAAVSRVILWGGGTSVIEKKDLTRFMVVGAVILIAVGFIVWKYFALMVLGTGAPAVGRSGRTVESGAIIDMTGRVLGVGNRQK